MFEWFRLRMIETSLRMLARCDCGKTGRGRAPKEGKRQARTKVVRTAFSGAGPLVLVEGQDPSWRVAPGRAGWENAHLGRARLFLELRVDMLALESRQARPEGKRGATATPMGTDATSQSRGRGEGGRGERKG